MKKIINVIFKIVMSILIAIMFLVFVVYKTNIAIKDNAIHSFIYIPTTKEELKNYDYIVVLATTINSDNTPSNALIDRLDRTVELYNLKPSIKVIVSGDDGGKKCDEVSVMKSYLIEKGVLEKNIIIDGKGTSTYNSVYDIKDIVGNSKTIFVSHGYHLYRILYLAKEKGIDASGVPAINNFSFYDEKYILREFLARTKDYFLNLINYKPSNNL